MAKQKALDKLRLNDPAENQQSLSVSDQCRPPPPPPPRKQDLPLYLELKSKCIKTPVNALSATHTHPRPQKTDPQAQQEWTDLRTMRQSPCVILHRSRLPHVSTSIKTVSPCHILPPEIAQAQDTESEWNVLDSVRTAELDL